MKCPACNSENTVKCSVAYQAGTATSSFGGVGIDLSGDIGGFGGVGSSQTLLARSVSPPQPRAKVFNPLTSLFLIVTRSLFLIAGVIGTAYGIIDYTEPTPHAKLPDILTICLSVVCLFVAVYLLSAEHARVMEAHRRDLEKWARQWVCMTCGTRFEPADAGSVRAEKPSEQLAHPTNASWEETVAAEDEVAKWAKKQDQRDAG